MGMKMGQAENNQKSCPSVLTSFTINFNEKFKMVRRLRWYWFQERSYASTLYFTLAHDSNGALNVILLSNWIQSFLSWTKQLILLHIAMLHSGFRGNGYEKAIFRTLRIFRESKSDCQTCNLTYKSEMHVWLIFFYYIASISGSHFTSVPFESEKHFWHGLKMNSQINRRHLPPFTGT